MQIPCHARRAKTAYACADRPAWCSPMQHARRPPLRCRAPQVKEQTMTTASGHTSAIRAKKVIGTSVKNTAGQKIGQVEDIVLDKQSNNIIFAVVGFGGFLGINEKFHPVPWSALDYDEMEDSY